MIDILVSTHGTLVMHGAALGAARVERVRQVQQCIASVQDSSHYVPVEHACDKLWRWHDHGTQIAFLGPSRRPEDMAKNERLLRQLDFPPGPLHHRRPSETYAEEVERISPAVFVEDDCESIGGKQEMASPHLSASARAQISCIVVPEFGGMDHLPDDSAERVEWSQTHPWPAS